MLRVLKIAPIFFALVAMTCPAHAQESKKSEKSTIKGGMEGTIKSVDHAKEMITVEMSGGKLRTFSINDETKIVGPRGGVVHRRLRDPRFHEGLAVTVVAAGELAAELHLGFDYGESASKGKTTHETGKMHPSESPVFEKPTPKTGTDEVKTQAKTLHTEPQKGSVEDEEVSGKVKSFDELKRHLVVASSTGKEHSYFLPSVVKLTVKGSASKLGLKDPSLKPGAAITVVTERGDKRVKEIHIAPPRVVPSKRAG